MTVKIGTKPNTRSIAAAALTLSAVLVLPGIANAQQDDHHWHDNGEQHQPAARPAPAPRPAQAPAGDFQRGGNPRPPAQWNGQGRPVQPQYTQGQGRPSWQGQRGDAGQPGGNGGWRGDGQWRGDGNQGRADNNQWRGGGNQWRGDGGQPRGDGGQWRAQGGQWRGGPGYSGTWHGGAWNHDWRQDNRYDWRGWREANRDTFHVGRYFSPYRGYGYNRVGVGFYLQPLFFGSNYWIADPWDYRLPPAYGPYHWVRYYNDVLLVNTYNGQVADVIYDFFW